MNVTLAANLYVNDRETFDALVAPTLDEAQTAEIMSAVRATLNEQGLKVVARQCDKGTSPEDVANLYDALQTVAEWASLMVTHKSSDTPGGWAGRTLRGVPVAGGQIKVILTDSK